MMFEKDIEKPCFELAAKGVFRLGRCYNLPAGRATRKARLPTVWSLDRWYQKTIGACRTKRPSAGKTASNSSSPSTGLSSLGYVNHADKLIRQDLLLSTTNSLMTASCLELFSQCRDLINTKYLTLAEDCVAQSSSWRRRILSIIYK